MKRVKHITSVGKYVTIKMTVELTSNKGTAPVRKQFIELMNYYVGQAVVGLHNLGFPITNTKVK